MWPRGGQNKTVGQARSWVPLTRALGGGKNLTQGWLRATVAACALRAEGLGYGITIPYLGY
jgi:hypothetical protein